MRVRFLLDAMQHGLWTATGSLRMEGRMSKAGELVSKTGWVGSIPTASVRS